jgi:ligand-binding sensor domain-containing protein
MRYRFSFLTGVFLLLPSVFLYGQEKTLFVSQLTEEDGLSPGSVMNFFQDTEGYLWICTIAGLNRYDGNQITTYISDPIDLNSLSATPIHDITQDGTGKMWIATRGGGLNSYDLQTEKFTHYRHDPVDSASIASDDLTYIDIDDQDQLWIGSQTGLTHFNPATGTAEQFYPAPGKEGRLQGNCRGEIIADSLRIYLGTSAGFEYFDRRSGSFRHFPLIDPESGDTIRYQVYGMVRDRLGKVWFGRREDGLRVYDPVTDTDRLHPEEAPARSPKVTADDGFEHFGDRL